MIEIIITSSVLILIITVLRYLLRGKISSRLQYALWTLVAVRLLLPFSLFESPVSVMNTLSDIQSDYSAAAQPAAPVNPGNTVLPSYDPSPPQSSHKISGSPAGTTNTAAIKSVAKFVWLSGLIFGGVFFAASNIRLNRKLKKTRKQIEKQQCPLTVYMADGLPSPCLYGFVKPAVYVTPESLSDERRTAYVIAHELTHYCHKDHIWSFIRVLCLCIHWFNPLVWLAAILSRRDSELACDEGTLRRIGLENRMEYGRTLIKMMTAPSKPSDIFCCTTAMTGSKREMAERIKRIAKQPKTLMITLSAVLIVVAAAVAFTFGGAVRKIPVTLPRSSEVTGITIKQISGGENLGAIQTSQKADVEKLLNALADTDKALLRESVNDAPSQDHYFQIDIDSSSTRRFYLYDDGQKYFVEEPYVGIYRTKRETNDVVAKIYTANGSADLSIDARELWNARTRYVGDNSAVGRLLNLLPLPEGLVHDHFVLRTTGTERGIEWVLREEKATAYNTRQLEQNALLLFALIDNLENFYVTIGNPPDDGTALHYIRSWADELVGGDVRDYAESPEKIRELIDFSVAEIPLYSIERLEKGKIVSDFPLEERELASAIIMDAAVKSAAWDGVDIATLKECFLIRQTFPKSNEIHDYYAYLLEDGRAVLQSGKDGWYSVLSKGLYSELLESWESRTATPWLENEYTEGVPRPDFDNLLSMWEDREKEYCAACYQGVSRERMETYLQALADDDWRTIRNFYENTAVGGLYKKSGHVISIQFDGEQIAMYFSLK